MNNALCAGYEWAASGPGPSAPDRTAGLRKSPLFLQFLQEVLPEFRDLGPDHIGTVRLRRVAEEVLLVIILRDVELRSRRDLGDDRAVVDSRSVQARDHLFRCRFLLGRVVKDR